MLCQPTVKEMATEILFYESITLKVCPVLKMLRHYKVDEKDKEEEFRSSCLLFTLSWVLFCCNRMVLWSSSSSSTLDELNDSLLGDLCLTLSALNPGQLSCFAISALLETFPLSRLTYH